MQRDILHIVIRLEGSTHLLVNPCVYQQEPIRRMQAYSVTPQRTKVMKLGNEQNRFALTRQHW